MVFAPQTVRKARLTDADGIAEVHVASWRSAYAGIVPESHLAGLSVEKRAEMWRNAISHHQRDILVAERDGRTVGFACGGPDRRPELTGCDLELYAIYLTSDCQGRGFGRWLVHELARALLTRAPEGSTASLSVWVLRENPSRGFYERLGGQLLPATQPVELGGKDFVEVAYRWPDLAALERTL